MNTLKHLLYAFCMTLLLVGVSRWWAHPVSRTEPALPYASLSPLQVYEPTGEYPEDVYWDERFAETNGVSNDIQTLAADENGNVYAGGSFTSVGGMPANYIARWDGSAWHALGEGVGGTVSAIAVSGSDVYVGGYFTTAGSGAANHIARWDGSVWHALGDGVSGGDTRVEAIAVSGSDVYVGGVFTTAGGASANGIARWEGSSWHTLEGGISGDYQGVFALAVSGNDVYVGGYFTTAGSVLANYIARWDGSAWYALEDGVGNGVTAMAVSGSDVYVGGDFTTAGGLPANHIARWDGSAWHALRQGMEGPSYSPIFITVMDIMVNGSNVYTVGSFTIADGMPANRVARWDGSTWHALGEGVEGGKYYSIVNAMAISGSDLYIGGSFMIAGGGPANHIARWDGGSWHTLGPVSNTLNGLIYAMDTDLSSNVYVGGDFTFAADVSAHRIARWDGNAWHALGEGIDGGEVYAVETSGSDVYVGGNFTTAGGLPANHIARWDGSAWYTLGQGIDFLGGDGFDNPCVLAITVSGSDVFVGGYFDTAGDVPAYSVARWDGSAWHNIDGPNGPVLALAADSRGNVYAGGAFCVSCSIEPFSNNIVDGDDTTAYNIARWDGSTWHNLGQGINGGNYTQVDAIAVSGSDVYVGGDFTTSGDVPAHDVALWNGSSWHALGDGVDWNVMAIAASDNEVFVGGYFDTAGGLPAKWIARWNGISWSPLGTGTDSTVNALVVANNQIFVGGEFSTAGSKPSNYFAIWHDTIPQLSIDHSVGAPGSSLTFTAKYFPPNSQATITINGYIFPPHSTDSNGQLTFAVHTSGSAPLGTYVANVSTAPQVTALVTFVLDSTAPILPIGSLTPLELPGSVFAYIPFVRLPLILR